MSASDEQPLFRPLSSDDPNPETTEIESFCLSCEENGITRLLLTKIPFYKEVVVMSFYCEHCGFRNNEIQSGKEIGEKGVRFVLNVKSPKELNRQVFTSDYSSIRIPELDFEMPAQSKKGQATTVEGVIRKAMSDLQQDQETRAKLHPNEAAQIDVFVGKLGQLCLTDESASKGFTFILEDMSGNAFIANPQAPLKDENCITTYFMRSKDQDRLLGIYESEQQPEPNQLNGGKFVLEDLMGEVLEFPTNCSNCSKPCTTNMKLTNVPHFKDVVIMSTNCDSCGLRNNEVKSGGGIEEEGVRIEVSVNNPTDYARDVLKSETCCLEVPELDLSVGPSAVSGRFTTVEGLLRAMKDQLSGSTGMLIDTCNDAESDQRMKTFLEKFNDLLDNWKPVTVILDDPAGNSYVQSLTDPEPDSSVRVTKYQRSFQQNEDLGLNDMKTENYENDE